MKNLINSCQEDVDFRALIKLYFMNSDYLPKVKEILGNNLQKDTIFYIYVNTIAIKKAMEEADISASGISPLVNITKALFPDFYYRLANELGYEIILYTSPEGDHTARVRKLLK